MALGTKLKTLDVTTAQNFRDTLSSKNVYLFLATPVEWDSWPTAPNSGVNEEIDTRNTILYLIKLSLADTVLAVPRVNWTFQDVYAQYSPSDPELFTKEFYVITSLNNVYKCMYNNSDGQSTVAPTGTSANVINTADGYQWKFMYNLSPLINQTFSLDEFTPVPTALQKTEEHISIETQSDYELGDPVNGHGSNAATELGASAVIVSKTIDLAFLSDSNNIFAHARFGIIVDPKLLNGDPLTASEYVIDSNSSLDVLSGDMLNIFNHPLVSSENDSTEIIQQVLTF